MPGDLNFAYPDDRRDRIALRFWQAGENGELTKLAGAIDQYWDRIHEAFRAVFAGYSALDCPESLLDLLAYQRDIERLPGEPLQLYRRRVHFAFANARDAGSVAGFRRIWERLELGAIGQGERVDDDNWDVILLTIDEAVFAAMADTYLDMLIAQYGRTCRRYRYQSVATQPKIVRAFEFYGDYYQTKAVYEGNTTILNGR